MFQGVKDWIKQPYSDNMSAAQWFLFFGFVIIAGVVWGMILKTLTD